MAVAGSSIFHPLSPQARAISDLFVILLIIAAAIFLVVAGILIVAILRFRARSDDEPYQEFGSARLEIGWTVAPALLLIGVFIMTIGAMSRAEPAGPGRPDLLVIGHQWWWEIHYPNGAVAANEIHLPTNRRLLVALQSGDVTHNLWLPQLGGKMQMIPGQTNYMWLEADAPGVYSGACSEFCGAEHAWMLLRAVAEPPAQFAAWERGQARPALAPAGAAARRGAALFGALTCASCHAIEGTAWRQRLGPDLTHLGSRATLAAGRLANTPADLAAWLRDPQAIKPGAHMPNLYLSEAQIGDLVAYLEGLR